MSKKAFVLSQTLFYGGLIAAVEIPSIAMIGELTSLAGYGIFLAAGVREKNGDTS